VEVGVTVGLLVGVTVGLLVGVTVGLLVGVTVGLLVGVTVGLLVGVTVGLLVGVTVGLLVGVTVGLLVGTVGAAVVGAEITQKIRVRAVSVSVMLVYSVNQICSSASLTYWSYQGSAGAPLLPRVAQVYGIKPVGVGENRHRSAGPQLGGKGHSTTPASQHTGDNRAGRE
jgi:hypothetical protein